MEGRAGKKGQKLAASALRSRVFPLRDWVMGVPFVEPFLGSGSRKIKETAKSWGLPHHIPWSSTDSHSKDGEQQCLQHAGLFPLPHGLPAATARAWDGVPEAQPKPKAAM